MAFSLAPTKQKVIIDDGTGDPLVLDCSLSETHGAEVEITDFPVEVGANISDHRRVKPKMLTIEGLVSNTPLPGTGDVSVPVTAFGQTWQSRSGGDGARAGDAFEYLESLVNTDALLTIVTGLTVYERMTVKSTAIPRAADTGQALRFTIIFQEIRLVQNATAQIVKKAKTTKAIPPVDQNKKPVTDDKTLLLQFSEDSANPSLSKTDVVNRLVARGLPFLGSN